MVAQAPAAADRVETLITEELGAYLMGVEHAAQAIQRTGPTNFTRGQLKSARKDVSDFVRRVAELSRTQPMSDGGVIEGTNLTTSGAIGQP